ncbi:hypothetical protein, partial [Leclercia sp.]|uniref:hypothetical protein n=1 Tax=Leclercia sp. TaxID=1898428 RepID=UPI0028AB5AE2
TFNQLVAGSNPARPTNVKRRPKGAFLLSSPMTFLFRFAILFSIQNTIAIHFAVSRKIKAMLLSQ